MAVNPLTGQPFHRSPFAPPPPSGPVGGAVRAAPKPKPKSKPKPKPKPRTRVAQRPVAPQGVDASTREKASRAPKPTPAGRRRVAPQGVDASTRANAARAQTPKARRAREARARILAEMDKEVLGGRPAAQPQAQPSPDDLRGRYAEGRTTVAGPGANIAGALDPIARASEPFINFTDMITEPFTTPAKVIGNLIAGEVDDAAKNIVSAGYWGDQTFPSEALADRGWVDPSTPWGKLIGLGSDTLPAFLLPGFKSPGRARGERAAREVSREQRIGRVETAPQGPPSPKAEGRWVADAQGRLVWKDAPSRPQRAKQERQRRQRRATRLQPGRGPDIITNPAARVVPQRPVKGGRDVGVRSGKPRRATQPPRRRVEDMPYPPTRAVAEGLRRRDEARTAVGAATARQPTRLQAANAGRRLGVAESALRSAERATVDRMRSTPVTRTGRQEAQIGAKFPVTKAGATKYNIDAPRRKTPPPAKPKNVPYSRLGELGRFVESARAEASALLRADKPPTVAQVRRASSVLANAQKAVAAAPKRGYGLTAGQAKAYERVISATNRIIALRSREGAQPTRAELVAAGRNLESAVRAYKTEARRIQSQIVTGRQAARRPAAPPRREPTRRQKRAAEPASTRSVFDTRPRNTGELRRSSVTPVEGGKRLPFARTRVNTATRKVEVVTGRGPTPKQAAKAGANLAKAEARLRKAEKKMWKDSRRPPVDPRPATSGQQRKHRETFTGSREREWIDANLDYQIAFERGRAEAPIGINITAPLRARSEGVTIPLASMEKSRAFRAWLSSESKGRVGKAAGDMFRWYHEMFVSRYGPNPVVRAGAVAADDITRAEMGRTARYIVDVTNKADLSDAEMKLASAWLEGTARGHVPQRVKEFATKLNALTAMQAAQFIRAGGELRRIGADGKLDGGLDMQYVYHLLPREEMDRFLASNLARRQVLYGSKPGFQKRRNVLTIEDLKKNGFHPIERLDQLTMARAMAHHRAMADMELGRSIETRFARDAKDAPDSWERMPSQFTNSEKVVPPDVAKSMRSILTSRLAVPGGKVSRGAARFNQGWKEWALMTLGYDIRNQVGDSTLTFQAESNPIAPIITAYQGVRQGVRKGSDTARVGGKSNLSIKQARNISEAGGMRSSGFVGGEVMRDVNRPGQQRNLDVTSKPQSKAAGRIPGAKAAKATRRAIFSARESRESVNRSGIFLRELRKGEGAVHATRKAKETVYDYRNVGRAVDWARRYPIGAPFLTWTAKNLPRQLELALKQPAQLSAILTGIESLQRLADSKDIRMNRDLLPDYVRDRMPIAIPGFGQTIIDLPANSLNRVPIPNGRFTDVTRQWFNEFGVGPKLVVAIAFDVNSLTGEKFRGLRAANLIERELQNAITGPVYALRRNAEGARERQPGVDDRIAYIFNSLLPGAGTAGRIAGRPGDSLLDRISSPVLGFSRTKPLDVNEARKMIRSLSYQVQVEMIPEFRRGMAANAPNWKQGDPIPRNLRRQYAEIRKKIGIAEMLAAFISDAERE